MPTASHTSAYALGSTDAEHERLLRQAALFDPFTERLFRDAGVGAGQRCLDIGSGLGDVSMLVASLVGPSGVVVGVDRDPSIVAKAQARVARAGLGNVTFTISDIGQVASSVPFDAIVGRLILEFVPDPSAVVCSLAKLLRPGGILAIQDACWGPFLQLSSHLPLRARCASLIYQAFERSGTNMDMESVLYRTFQEAGMPPPNMRIEVPVGGGPEFIRWVYDLFCSLHPRMQQHSLPWAPVGNLDTLLERLENEAAANRTFVSCVGLVGAWSRKSGEH